MQSAHASKDDDLPRPFRIAAGRVRARFGEVADAGFQPLPDVLLFHQSELKVSSEELNVLLNLLAHWYEPERMPFPRPATIARRIGVSERTVQRLLVKLCKRGLIEKVKEQNATGTPAYDVRPLIENLRPYARKRLALLPRTQEREGVAQRIEPPSSACVSTKS